jgi:hypothetical protein
VPNFSILLGSDLEEEGSGQTDWSIIVNSHLPQIGKASVFKVPHHGSKTAHHPHVWSDMPNRDPIVALTPFQRGRVQLPTKDDMLLYVH